MLVKGHFVKLALAHWNYVMNVCGPVARFLQCGSDRRLSSGEILMPEVLNLVEAKVTEVMKMVRGSWPSWPPPPDVNVDAVTLSAVMIITSGTDYRERQVELLRCHIQAAVKTGFMQCESFAHLVASSSASEPPTSNTEFTSKLPNWTSDLKAVSKRGMAQQQKNKKKR